MTLLPAGCPSVGNTDQRGSNVPGVPSTRRPGVSFAAGDVLPSVPVRVARVSGRAVGPGCTVTVSAETA